MNPRISLLVLLFFIAHGMDMGHFRRHTFRDPYCSFHGLTEVAWQAATKEFYVCLRRVDVQAEFNYKASRIATLTANDLVQVYGLLHRNEVGLPKRIKGCEPEVHSVMRIFKSLCYSANWKVVDSKEYVLPQRRHRCWIWAFHNVLAASPLGFGSEADKAMPETLEALKSKAISPSRLFQLMGISERRLETDRVLNTRQQGVVSACEAKLQARWHRMGTDTLAQESADVFLDVAKSEKRSPFCEDATTCIVPNSLPYSLKEKRFLETEEVMAVQGIFKEDFPAMLNFIENSTCLVRDLAGNAFTTSVCIAVCIAAFLHGPLGAVMAGRRRRAFLEPGDNVMGGRHRRALLEVNTVTHAFVKAEPLTKFRRLRKMSAQVTAVLSDSQIMG